MQFADRLHAFQSNVFADMDQAKNLARAAGQSVIDLSLGSSDLAVSQPHPGRDRPLSPRSQYPWLLALPWHSIFSGRRRPLVWGSLWP